ncbi:MAG: hypothetical protein ABSA27_10605 [Terriglobales bacterium]|jgi:hypothetical protein
MEMDDVQSMARISYGYGTWAAPYWFLGPEQGMAPFENDDLKRRIEAWRYFGSRDLDDCREFHLRIGETRWHNENAILQSTWKKLLLTLMAYFGRSTDEGTRLDYQRHEWGSQSGETCVIELSGLAAHSLKVERDRECFRAERVSEIRERMRVHKPEFVVMYGKSRKYWKAWNEISDGAKAISEGDFTFADLRKSGPTSLALTPAPTSWGPTNENWIELGKKLRKLGTGS